MRNETISTALTLGSNPSASGAHQTLDAAVLSGLSLPVWVLDLSRFARPATMRHGDVEDGSNTLHRDFVASAAVRCVNAAAVAFHKASDATQLLGALERIFRPESVRSLVCALNDSQDATSCEHDIALGALDGTVRRTRARFDTIATDTATSCLAVILLPDAPRSNLLRVIPDLAFELDATGIYVDFAGPTEDAFVAPSEFLGKSITDTLPPDVAHRALAALQRLREHGGSERFEYALSMSDGLHWYEARMSALPSGGASAYVRDITEQKSAEWRYQESERRFRALEASVEERTAALEIANRELDALRNNDRKVAS